MGRWAFQIVAINLTKCPSSAKSLVKGYIFCWRHSLDLQANDYRLQTLILPSCVSSFHNWVIDTIITASLAISTSDHNYRQTSNINCTKSQNLNVSCLFFQLSLPTNPIKPSVKSRMKMQFEQHWLALLQLHLSDQQFYCLIWCVIYQRSEGSDLTKETINTIASSLGNIVLYY